MIVNKDVDDSYQRLDHEGGAKFSNRKIEFKMEKMHPLTKTDTWVALSNPIFNTKKSKNDDKSENDP